MERSKIIGAIVAGIVVILVAICLIGGVGKNNAQSWQVIQSPTGNIRIQDEAGWYLKWFSTVWTYPRYMDATFNDVNGEGKKEKESIRATFNDGGTAQVSTYILFGTPIEQEKRIEFHRMFSGNMDNIEMAVKAHMINCIKTTAPVMSASEHQSARKAEFNKLVEEQLTNGLYQMRKVATEMKDQFDESGKPITVYVTEIMLDTDGKPLLGQPSPLSAYGIVVLQFSVTETEYDEEIIKQFAAKKDAFLKAEQSKASQAAAMAERLNVTEEGKKNVAKAEAEANVIKKTAVVKAEQAAEVALQTKKEQETKAAMELSVAETAKKTAEVLLQTAKLKADAVIAEAEGKKQAINLAGEITQLEKAKIEAEVAKATAIADGISKLQMPSVMFFGGSGAGAGGDITNYLMNLKLLESTGLLEKSKSDITSVNIDRLKKESVQK